MSPEPMTIDMTADSPEGPSQDYDGSYTEEIKNFPSLTEKFNRCAARQGPPIPLARFQMPHFVPTLRETQSSASLTARGPCLQRPVRDWGLRVGLPHLPAREPQPEEGGTKFVDLPQRAQVSPPVGGRWLPRWAWPGVDLACTRALLSALRRSVVNNEEIPDKKYARAARFQLSLLNVDPAKTVRKDTTHIFTRREMDWGFSELLKLQTVLEPGSGFLDEQGTLRVRVDVKVLYGPDYPGYDPRKETGFVGITNQGATCYLNSLLQTLFHLPAFRRAVYKIPTRRDPHTGMSWHETRGETLLPRRDACVS